MFEPVDQKIDFPRREERILELWREARIFEKSLQQRAGAPSFVFFEGPPTANGTPHNGHVLTRVIKDLFPRFKTMRGFYCARKAGWDTHGLPVEVEVEKELGIHGKADIEAYGVEDFTRRCIESVFRYTDVWEQLTERIGFWVDTKEAYVTFHQSYVESVWWALKRLFDQGLLYQGHKVVWWWPQGGTALSSGEVGLGYKTVDDPSITVRFPVAGEPGVAFLAWTTTPWTLPSNCALTVHPEIRYAWVRWQDETVILAEALCDAVLGAGTYEVLRTAPGRDLVGTRYQPVFDYARPAEGDCHVVIPGDFVSLGTGTGVVHTAPAFGEDDHRVARQNGIGLLNLVAPDGTFLPEVTDFAGRFVKEADRDIIRNLRKRGLLVKEEVYRHDYPFCWRADDDPLIQYARPAWFIRTTDLIGQAIENNRAIDWLPPHIKEGRFGDFLQNNVDWALSRERYWGTPLPIWICAGCGAMEAFDSADALTARNPAAFDAFKAAQATDPSLSEHLAVHKPWIDAVTVPCAACSAEMRRVPEVIDCWFDSGSMPFAQWGYPHRGQEAFEAAWPADFISEAIDQTRGWFYGLLMISTLLFPDRAIPHPFRSCIVLGHVCDKDGKKESKSKGNYTPPEVILQNNGADAMRWYFYSANPPHNNTRYSAEAVRQSQQEFLNKLHNVYSFFTIYANIDGFAPAVSPRRPAAERPLIDRWVLSELHRTLREVTVRMDEYRVYESAQRIMTLTDALSNWYVRRCRDRFWRADKDADKWDAYHTLYEVLVAMSRMCAPFVPFIAEDLHQNLVRNAAPDAPESVHLCDWPEFDPALIDEALSEEMQTVRDIVSLGLANRASHKLKVRQPLPEVEVVLAHPALTDRVAAYEALIAEELNVKRVVFTQQAGHFVTFTVKPNYRTLGPLFGKRMPLVRKALDAADAAAVRGQLAERGEITLTLADGEAATLGADVVEVSADAREGYAAEAGAVGVVVLDTRIDDALRAEGVARELVSKIQALRKDQALEYTARIEVFVSGDPALLEACRTFRDTIARETLARAIHVGEPPPAGLATADAKVDDAVATVAIRAV